MSSAPPLILQLSCTGWEQMTAGEDIWGRALLREAAGDGGTKGEEQIPKNGTRNQGRSLKRSVEGGSNTELRSSRGVQRPSMLTPQRSQSTLRADPTQTAPVTSQQHLTEMSGALHCARWTHDHSDSRGYQIMERKRDQNTNAGQKYQEAGESGW